jgi:hypothetical protein
MPLSSGKSAGKNALFPPAAKTVRIFLNYLVIQICTDWCESVTVLLHPSQSLQAINHGLRGKLWFCQVQSGQVF